MDIARLYPLQVAVSGEDDRLFSAMNLILIGHYNSLSAHFKDHVRSKTQEFSDMDTFPWQACLAEFHDIVSTNI